MLHLTAQQLNQCIKESKLFKVDINKQISQRFESAPAVVERTRGLSTGVGDHLNRLKCLLFLVRWLHFNAKVDRTHKQPHVDVCECETVSLAVVTS